MRPGVGGRYAAVMATVDRLPAHRTHEVTNQPPPLQGYDLFGEDTVLRESVAREAGIPSLPWREPRPGAHVVRGALLMLLSQAESGVSCPLSMTYAAIPAIRHAPDLAAEWEPRLLDPDPDRSALCGMAMTEKQG